MVHPFNFFIDPARLIIRLHSADRPGFEPRAKPGSVQTSKLIPNYYRKKLIIFYLFVFVFPYSNEIFRCHKLC